ncbi:MAG: hypothetical protein HN855_17120 [Anaerolineae bacterium]|jgi:hypothetical protein|nr:hypothetical protein [Anaerolineae bacterium]MBT7072688.1 hypothetical protein [Anaerolineae bacterium]MBT7326869.1 hypothetical protein [Anaerolineae bacterium]
MNKKRLYLTTVLALLLLFTFACSIFDAPPTPAANTDKIATSVALTTEAMQPQSAPPTQPPPPAPTLTDEEAIKQALLVKLGWTAAELDFSMGDNTGTLARGGVKKVGEMQGAAWFAGKDSAGKWIIAHIGQGIPNCVDIQAFNFPTTWISHCVDASGNTVALGQPTLTDEEAIKQALLAKLGWTAAELDFSMGTNTGTVATGGVKKVGEMSGAGWFAGKDSSGTWIIAYIGQGIPYCSEIQAFNFPTTWISHCMDDYDNTIER